MGCSPSLSGAIRVNPWSVEALCDGMYAAIKMPLEHRQLRHEKHWRYVSQHTVAYWASSYVSDLQVGPGIYSHPHTTKHQPLSDPVSPLGTHLCKGRMLCTSSPCSFKRVTK